MPDLALEEMLRAADGNSFAGASDYATAAIAKSMKATTCACLGLMTAWPMVYVLH